MKLSELHKLQRELNSLTVSYCKDNNTLVRFCDVDDMLMGVYEASKENHYLDYDLYRELINKHGKGKVWNSNPDEICDMIEKMLKEE